MVTFEQFDFVCLFCACVCVCDYSSFLVMSMTLVAVHHSIYFFFIGRLLVFSGGITFNSLVQLLSFLLLGL